MSMYDNLLIPNFTVKTPRNGIIIIYNLTLVNRHRDRDRNYKTIKITYNSHFKTLN